MLAAPRKWWFETAASPVAFGGKVSFCPVSRPAGCTRKMVVEKKEKNDCPTVKRLPCLGVPSPVLGFGPGSLGVSLPLVLTKQLEPQLKVCACWLAPLASSP